MWGDELKIRRSRWGRSTRPLVIYAGLGLAALVTVAPILWMVSLSLKPPGEVFTPTPTLLPRFPTVENYVVGWRKSGFQQFFINSLIIAVSAVGLSILSNSLAGYALAKFRFSGRQLIFITFLSAIMIPDQVRMVPLYVLMRELHWVNTWQAVILPGVSRAFGVFLMKQYMETIPDELLEAARIDGASELRILWQVVMPLCLPAVATVVIFEFLFRWNDLLWPLVALKSTDMYTVQIGLAQLRFDPTIGGGPVMGMALVSSLPALLLFFALQRHFVRGIATSGLRG